MNRFSMLSTAPKGMRKVPSPGAPSDVAMPNVRKPRAAPRTTRDYGKPDTAPIGPSMFGGTNGDKSYR